MSQESLSNARRHAPGAPVTVRTLRDAGRLSITVTSEGASGHGSCGPHEPYGNALTGMAERVRLVGGSASQLLEAVGGRTDLTVHDGPVTGSGRVEMLPFLREQAIAITAHRFGTPSRIVDAVPLTAPA